MGISASKLSILVLVVASSLVWSCGGKRIATTKPVEIAVPADFAKGFDVKELPAQEVKVEQAVKPEKPGKKSKVKKEKGFVIPNRRPKNDPIWPGEKIWMDVTWLNTKAGEFLLEVLPYKEMNGRKVYNLKGTARTSDLFSLVYKAEDWVESYVDYEGWIPYKFVLHGDETKHIRNNLELFDHAAKKQYVHIIDYRTKTNETHEDKGVKDLVPLAQDSLSALHFVRIFNLSPGGEIQFPMTANGTQWTMVVKVLGREEVQTRMGYMPAIKTKVETRFNGGMAQQGDAFIWFSDDDRKYPLRFEAKVRIGWVAGIAKQIEPGTRPNSDEVSDTKPSTPGASGHAGEASNRPWFEDLISK